MLTDDELRGLYTSTKLIAVVGLSDDPDRPSHRVATYLKNQGYTVIPVNPKYAIIVGEKCYPDLHSVMADISPQQIDIVDIFRRPEDVLPHIEEAIAVNAKAVWLQEGIEHIDGRNKARSVGLTVEMNRCLMKEHQRLFGDT